MSYTPQIINKVIPQNSSVVPLTSGQTYTGQFVDVSQHSSVVMACLTDKNGTLYIDFSPDGVNVDSTLSWAVVANINEVHRITITRQYCRLRFTNTSSEDQTFFRLQCLVGEHTPLTFGLAPPSLPNDWDSVVTRSVLTGENPQGSFVNERSSGYVFQTNTPLSGSGVYESGIISTDGYTQIETELVSDQPGVVTGTWYADAEGTQVIRTFMRPYSASDAGNYVYFSAPVFGPYLKYQYSNGTTPQTEFYFALRYLNQPISGQILGLTDFIPTNVVANLGRNVLVGQDNSKNFRNVPVDAHGDIRVNVHEPLTAFGELRTAELTPIIQLTMPYELNYDLISSGQSINLGSVTYNSGTTEAHINSGSDSGSTGVMVTRQLAKYRNGQGLLIRFTAKFTSGTTGNNQWMGWGDDENGFFFGYSGETFGILRRNNNVEYFTPQTSWIYDVMDGSGSLSNPSNQLLNPQNGNVYQIQLQWLGYGSIKFSIENGDEGEMASCHLIQYPNKNTVPSIINPTYPIRGESNNITNTSEVTIKTPSMAAFVEGQVKFTGPGYSISSSKETSANTNIITLSNPTTYKGKKNKTRILLSNLSLSNENNANNPVRYKLVRDGIITSPSYSGVSTYSVISSDVSGTYTASSGDRLFSAAIAKNQSNNINLLPYEIFINPGETLSIISLDSSTLSSVGLSWVEDI